MILAKDTPGAIRERLAGRTSVADLSIISDPVSGQVRYELTAPVSYRVQLREKIRSFLLLNPGAGKRQLRDLGKSDVIDELIGELVEEGAVKVEHNAGRHAHFWID